MLKSKENNSSASYKNPKPWSSLDSSCFTVLTVEEQKHYEKNSILLLNPEYLFWRKLDLCQCSWQWSLPPNGEHQKIAVT